jgi:hypothetical protein
LTISPIIRIKQGLTVHESMDMLKTTLFVTHLSTSGTGPTVLVIWQSWWSDRQHPLLESADMASLYPSDRSYGYTCHTVLDCWTTGSVSSNGLSRFRTSPQESVTGLRHEIPPQIINSCFTQGERSHRRWVHFSVRLFTFLGCSGISRTLYLNTPAALPSGTQ